MTVVKKSSNYGMPPTLPVVTLPLSSRPGPPAKGIAENHSDCNDLIENREPATATTTMMYKSANSEDDSDPSIQNAETPLIQGPEVVEMSTNRLSAQVAPLKLAPKSCLVASSEQTSPENVISNLPEDLDDNTINTPDVQESSGSVMSTRDPPGLLTSTMDGDESANIVDQDKVTSAGDSDDVESLPDPQLAANNKPVADKDAQGPRFKSKLPLAVRLHKDPPYPPPSFPLPTPPGEPRPLQPRGRAPSLGAKAYPLSPFPREHHLPKAPANKSLLAHLTQQPTPDSSPTEKHLHEETIAQKANAETDQSSFPTFGSSSLESSSRYSNSVELVDPNKSIQTSEAGPKVPTVVVSNPAATESQADLVEASEMPTDTGSPIFYGRRRGRNAPPPKNTATQGHPDTLQQTGAGATDSHGASGDGQTTPFTLPPISRLTPFTASKPPRKVVDATAELRKLAGDPSPPNNGRPQTRPQGGQQIHRSYHVAGNPLEPHVELYEDTVIRHPQVPAPSRGTDRIHPSSVVAASTPSKLLTHDFIRGMIHTELTQFQHDLRTSSITRPGALAMLSRAVETSSDDAEIQAQNAAAEGRIFVAVVDAITREDRLDQFGGSLGEDPFYDTGSNEGLNHMSGPPDHGFSFGQSHGYTAGFPYTGTFSLNQHHHHAPIPVLPPNYPYPVLQQPPAFPSYLVPPPTPASSAPSHAHPQAQQPALQHQPTQQTTTSQLAPASRATTHPAAPLWAPSSENQVVVRPAPGPFLYAGTDPEEMKRKDEEKRQKRRERERDRAQKKEEKNKQKANEEALKELRKSQSRDSSSLHGSTGGAWGSGGSEGGGSAAGSASLKPKASFGGSLRRAFNAFKKPGLNAPGPAPVEEEEDCVRESGERGRSLEGGLGHPGYGRGHGHPGHGHGHGQSHPGPSSSHGHGHGFGHAHDRIQDDHPREQ
ncbi:uncharacterized protein F4807DRAFT_467265 [Annulohypoxylon truncatum]|uniref:uncharacterized protein n=1 Tax=Annulohypoxylon truncatum TaxID=327061 RepID=UPI0020078A49|nr:uncharacterized protein F4807DRAFT_467265 [Annulohypoxylon truncatum]KAI1210134.1 hypothetical protein F4807DRAFT_467265 [Annulohypoxylon truncatum]